MFKLGELKVEDQILRPKRINELPVLWDFFFRMPCSFLSTGFLKSGPCQISPCAFVQPRLFPRLNFWTIQYYVTKTFEFASVSAVDELVIRILKGIECVHVVKGKYEQL